MSKRSPILAAVLGFTVFGIFYSAGLKKGLLGCIALCLVSWFCAAVLGSVELSCIANVAGAYLGYRWAHEHNAELEGLSDSPVQP